MKSKWLKGFGIFFLAILLSKFYEGYMNDGLEGILISICFLGSIIIVKLDK